MTFLGFIAIMCIDIILYRFYNKVNRVLNKFKPKNNKFVNNCNFALKLEYSKGGII